ncbi:restriction endonuclease subunit S [Zunongwangia profunda]|uniref:restriction endonuclease subunit S n=1 Tax=Zunongwangia profunda TaxID=398743 RepID=UPI001D186F66|nr:restriction endonuclease subunit S [Zunongwangia profunda]MCC4226785.1 restriction endonuclease subunit S [Zunongwangia profunda]
MPENWNTYKLGDLLTLNYGKSLTASKRKEGNIPVFSSSGRTGWHNKPLVKEEGIIVGRKGTVGSIFKTQGPFYCIDTAYYILRKDPVYDFDFLFYLLHTIGLNKLNFDSAVPGLNRNIAYDQQISLPPLQEQKSIASILSALDDKIELNLQMNKTLEEMAMALYKHWFVDFGPFQDGEFVDSELGEIPKGWEIKKLEDLLEIKYGKDHKKLEDGNIPVYGSGGIMRYVDTFLYDQESILIPRKGTLSNLFYLSKPFWSVDTMFYSKFKKQNFGKYIFHFLKSQDLASMDVGSAVPSLTTELLKRIKILVPSIQEVEKFNEIVSGYFEVMESNKDENKTLTQLRDTLLPKLISGEVHVKDVEKTLSEVL